jgi:serine protease AprX
MFFNEKVATSGKGITKHKAISILAGCGLVIGLCINAVDDFSALTLTDNSVVKQSNKAVTNNELSPSYIISAVSFQQLQNHLKQLNIVPTHELPVISAVAVNLGEKQLAVLKQRINVTVTENYQVKLSGKAIGIRRWQPQAVVADYVEANGAHQQGNYGDAVTIGFLDTGLDNLVGLGTDLYGRDKYWGTFDAVNNIAYNSDHEANGHGTHIASIASNSDFDVNGKIYGVAPNAKLVGIKAFDDQGKATYADVIRGIEWAITKKDEINLRILNMSFSGPARSHYWEDPLNQAVMRAWQAGIVVVTSAGNLGPEPMTVGVPGNLPYVITVGAMTDNYTPTDLSDDKLATFSSAGPTVEGFIKPELVAPGGHMSGLMSLDSVIVTEHPDFHDGGRYYEMSGTSQATGVVSGVIALMLTADPGLTPDEVKCKLISGARAAMKGDDTMGYSVFQQGAGVVNAKDSLASTETGCANQQMDIAMDLANTQHYHGPAAINAAGDIYVEGKDDSYIWKVANGITSDGGLIWKNSFGTDGGLIWKNNFGTDGGLIWKNNYDATSSLSWHTDFETKSAFTYNTELDIDGGLIWKNNAVFSNAEGIGVNNWVEQE